MKMRNGLILILVMVFTIYCGKGENGQIKAPGVVEGDVITLKSQVTGTVEIMDTKEGATIEKGTVLAKIDSAKTANKIKELEIALKDIEIKRSKLTNKATYVNGSMKYLQKQVDRFKRLRKSRSVAGEKVESMELRLLEARTTRLDLTRSLEELDIMESKTRNKMEYLALVLKDHSIESPVSGAVLETFVSQGENVFPNIPIADVLDMSSLYVEVFIEEGEMASLRMNQRAQILIDGIEDRQLSGQVTFFGKKAEFSPKYIISEKERKSLLYRVKVTIDKDIDLFKIGMPVTVVFD
ncbi:MAG: HlyD family efflux transporter periplasmic adaptor subunit [bacterium]|nr:HlyD family efflux transporter periplasmic adaptor subunit [bacterium]